MNSLGMELLNKVVIFKQEYMTVPATEHPYQVEGGFGSFGYTTGSALQGRFLSDGEVVRMEGYMIDRIATKEEVDAARAIGSLINDPESPFYGLVKKGR